MFDIFIDILWGAMTLGLVVFLFYALAVSPSEEDMARYRHIKEKGIEFLELLNGSEWALEDISILDPHQQDDLVEQLGFEAEVIREFIRIAETLPEIKQVTSKVSGAWDLTRNEYKNTRRSMRGMGFPMSRNPGIF